MPEGPECHIIGNKLHKILGGTKLLSIEILGGRYQKHGPPSGYDAFTETSDEITIEEIKVIGKLIYCTRTVQEMDKEEEVKKGNLGAIKEDSDKIFLKI